MIGPVQEEPPRAWAILLLLVHPPLPGVLRPLQHVVGIVPARDEAQVCRVQAQHVMHRLWHLRTGEHVQLLRVAVPVGVRALHVQVQRLLDPHLIQVDAVPVDVAIDVVHPHRDVRGVPGPPLCPAGWDLAAQPFHLHPLAIFCREERPEPFTKALNVELDAGRWTGLGVVVLIIDEDEGLCPIWRYACEGLDNAIIEELLLVDHELHTGRQLQRRPRGSRNRVRNHTLVHRATPRGRHHARHAACHHHRLFWPDPCI